MLKEGEVLSMYMHSHYGRNMYSDAEWDELTECQINTMSFKAFAVRVRIEELKIAIKLTIMNKFKK